MLPVKVKQILQNESEIGGTQTINAGKSVQITMWGTNIEQELSQ